MQSFVTTNISITSLSHQQSFAELLQQSFHNQSIILNQDQLLFAMSHTHKQSFFKLLAEYCVKKKIQIKRNKISWLYGSQMILTPVQFLERIKKLQLPTRCMRPIPQDFQETLQRISKIHGGYLPNLEILLMMFPGYLKLFSELQFYLMESQNSPIEQTEAYALGILAASTYGSVYLFARLVRRYKEIGGELKWLQGQMPQKISALKKLNGILAYSPWACTDKLLLQAKQKTGFNNLQLMHIIVILTFYQGVACLSLCNGVLPQQSIAWLSPFIDLSELEQLQFWQKSPFQSFISEQDLNTKQSQDVEKVFSLQQVAEQFEMQKKAYQTTKLDRYNRKGWAQQAYQQQRQQWDKPRLISSNQDLVSHTYMKEIDKQIKSGERFQKILRAFYNFLDPNLKVERFDTAKFPYLEWSTYNFKYGSFAFLSDLSNELATTLTDLVQFTKAMTNHSIGNKKISTQSLRRAIRFYYQNLSGFRHQDYNYRKNMTDFMSKQIRFFIKIVTHYPFLMQKSVLQNMPHEKCILSYFDSIHISLLCINTKMELAIMMGTRAFKKVLS